MNTGDPPDWRALEILVAKIQASLAPDAKIEHNVRIVGKSGVPRQIDVLVRQKVGQYVMTIAIDCKDYAGPVDINDVEAFQGILDDVGAHKGALVAPNGFTAGAKSRAKTLDIDLYSPLDTDPHKWSVNVNARIVVEVIRPRVAFGITTSTPKDFRLRQDFWNLDVRDASGATLDTPMAAVVRRWNDQELPQEAGEHRDIPLFAGSTFVDNGFGEDIEIRFTINLFIEARLYTGTLSIEKFSGFRDEHEQRIISRGFTTGNLDLEEVISTWEQIPSLDALLRPHLMILYVASSIDDHQIGPALPRG